MSLNIKDHEVHEMAREIAAMHRISMTGAVREALREKLEKDKAEQLARNLPGKKSRHELLTEFSALTAPLFKDGRSGNDLINDLYDEVTGLPK